MSKKRFIKLLMSKGIQRNEAQKIAARYNSCNIPYEKAYSDFLLKNGVAFAFKRLGQYFTNLNAALSNLSYTAKQALSKINKRMVKGGVIK